MNVTDSNEFVERLKELVEKHQVCYEVWPETLLVNGQRVKVGFELQLYGSHQHGKTEFSPGCRLCVETFEDLRQIAERIMPKEERLSLYEIEPYDRSLHLEPKRKFRPEVALTMKILHRHGFDQPVDQCEERCLKEMKEKLEQLGVRQGEWHSGKAPTV